MARGAVRSSVRQGEIASPVGDAAPPLQILRLDGVRQPVILPDEPPFLAAIQSCIRAWPGTLRPMDPAVPLPAPPLCVIEPRAPGRYRAHSCYLDQPLDDLAGATAICVVLADLAQAFAEADSTYAFGLHGGCLSIGAHTLVVAGEKRAGKSTLVARLSAEDAVRVLCDDVLPIATDGTALALGLAPRLRMPLPAAAAPRFRDHVARWLGPADDRYGYLLPPALLPHGQRVQADVLLVLDRRPDGPARLHCLPKDEALHHILQRTITGPDGADATFAATLRLTKQLTGYRLIYSDLEDAVTLLLHAFGSDDLPLEGAGPVLPPLPQGPSGTAPSGPLPIPVEQSFRRVPGTTVRKVGKAAFLWRPGDAILWHLNPVARAIWTLLARPASAETLAGLLAEAFPDQDPARLLEDVAQLLARLLAEELVAQA